eukprot:2220767-Ditylum_brightwellii.AAC.1
MLPYVPLNVSALEASSALKPWLELWIPAATTYLDPDNWFEWGHDIAGWKRNDGMMWTPMIWSGT